MIWTKVYIHLVAIFLGTYARIAVISLLIQKTLTVRLSNSDEPDQSKGAVSLYSTWYEILNIFPKSFATYQVPVNDFLVLEKKVLKGVWS